MRKAEDRALIGPLSTTEVGATDEPSHQVAIQEPAVRELRE